MHRALLLVMTAVFTTASCGDGPTESNTGPRLRVVAGAEATDTIGATPAQGLVVQVWDESGKPASGVQVRFESDNGGGMLVSNVANDYWDIFKEAITDENGRATVRVLYRLRAGPAWIAVSVPLYNLTDTARYTVQPGAAVRISFAPKDTVIVPGATFTYRGGVVDRAGNPRNDAATYEVSGTAVTVTNAGNASGVGFGFAAVNARATIDGVSMVDSGTVAVVPAATIAWNAGNNKELVVSTLTADNKTTLGAVGTGAAWEPGGNRLVASNSGLVIVAANGTTTSLPTPGFVNASWPEWSTDGFIYFHGEVQNVRRVARIRPDGSQLQTLTPVDQASMPSPSPDGSRVVYVSGSFAGLLSILNLATGTRTTLTAADTAQAPRWSPDGQWIAYTTYPHGDLMLIRPDGTGMHRIGGHRLLAGITWSPDSKWILGIESHATLVDVNAGVMGYLRNLPFGSRYPAWKRGS